MTLTRRVIATLVLLALALPGSAQRKKLYCWNESGRKVCGDSLPASAVNNARTEINARSGLATRQLDRALTEEERIAAGAGAELARLEAQATAAAARRDMAMVESYTNETELRRAFAHRTNLLDETVKATQLGVAGQRQSLLSLLRQASQAELAGKPVAKALAGNIRSQHAALRRHQALLVQQRAGRASIESELTAALERYRALKLPAPPDNQ